MIPVGSWTCDTKPHIFKNYAQPLPEQRFGSAYDVAVGAAELSQSDGRLDMRNWIVYQDSGYVVVRGAIDGTTWGSPVTLFEEAAAISDLALAFDNLGRPAVSYRKAAGGVFLWFYDSQLGAITTKLISETGITPVMDFDIKSDSSSVDADIMLFYVQDDAIFMRLQRDRFEVAYPTGVQYPFLRLEKAGMTEDNRFQVVYTFRDLRDGSMQHRKSLETSTHIMRQLQGHALEVGFRIALAPSHCELRALTRRYGTNWNGFYTIVDHSGMHQATGATFEEHLFTLQFMFVDVDDITNQDIIVRLQRTGFDGGDYFVFQTDAITFSSGDYILRFTQAAPDNGTAMKRIELVKDGVTVIDRVEIDAESPVGDVMPTVRNRLRFGAACEMNVSGAVAAESDVTVYKHLFPAVFTNIYTIADGVRTDWPKAYSDRFTQSAPTGNPLTLHRDGDKSYIFKGGSGAVDVAGVAPFLLRAPSIYQTNELILTYRADLGSFGGDIPLVISYVWRVNGVPSEVQGVEFVVGTDYPGDSIDMVVTATNQAGALSVTTNNIIVNFGEAPFLLTAPSIYGTPSLGGIMHLVQGDYGGDVPMTIVVQWRRNGVDIPGATSSPYTVTEDDIGQSIDCRVTATNATGSSDFYTNNQIMGYGSPIIINNPSISGQVEVGSTLSVTPGTYNGDAPMTVTRNWQRNGANIAGATGTTYVVQTDDLGTSITCLETISNPLGTVTASSNVLRVSGLAPSITTVPSIAGDKSIGGTLTLTPGTYSGQQPLNINRQWLSNGTAIAGATGTTYTVQQQDDGKSISCAEYISNDVGTISANSNVILIGTTPLFVITPPQVFKGGNVVYRYQGIYGGDGPFTKVNQWRRDGVAIVGETGDTYAVRESDAGSQISLAETMTNPVGSLTTVSNAVAIEGSIPYITTQPVISGSSIVGSGLTVTGTVFGGNAPQTWSYQWYRLTFGMTGETYLAEIAGATGTTYVTQSADVGAKVFVRVTATNNLGTGTADSAMLMITEVATPPPGSDIAPGLGIADAHDFVVNDTRNPVTSTAFVVFRPDGSSSYSTESGMGNGRYLTGTNGVDYVLSYSIVWGPALNGLAADTALPLSSMVALSLTTTSRFDSLVSGRYVFKVHKASDPSIFATADIIVAAETYSSYLANNN
jgi:hypothetical protein